jgi:hypothetical protein
MSMQIEKNQHDRNIHEREFAPNHETNTMPEATGIQNGNTGDISILKL